MKTFFSFLIISLISLVAFSATVRNPAPGDSPTAAMRTDGAGALALGCTTGNCPTLQKGPELISDTSTIYRPERKYQRSSQPADVDTEN